MIIIGEMEITVATRKTIERTEQEDEALRDRILKSKKCPKCENEKQEHREYCWLCTPVGDEDGK